MLRLAEGGLSRHLWRTSRCGGVMADIPRLSAHHLSAAAGAGAIRMAWRPDNGPSAGLLSPVSAGIGLPFERVHSSLVSATLRSIIRSVPVNLRGRHKTGALPASVCLHLFHPAACSMICPAPNEICHLLLIKMLQILEKRA